MIMFNTVIGNLPINIASMNFYGGSKSNFDEVHRALRTAWSTERGRVYAHKIAMLDISFADYHQIRFPSP